MAKKEPNFEHLLAGIESIIAELESGELPLDKMIERYENGVKALEECRKILDQAEKKIEILLQGEDGKLTPKPFDPNVDGKTGTT